MGNVVAEQGFFEELIERVPIECRRRDLQWPAIKSLLVAYELRNRNSIEQITLGGGDYGHHLERRSRKTYSPS